MDEVSKKFNSQQKVLRYGDKTYKIFKDGTMQSYTNPLRNLKSKNYFPFILRAKCYPVTKTVRNLKKKKKTLGGGLSLSSSGRHLGSGTPRDLGN
jgi:hypothetical protein